MTQEKSSEESIVEKLNKLIEAKKDESSALKKIFESIDIEHKSFFKEASKKQKRK